MKKLLAITGLLEVGTGLALLIVPADVGRLLFGTGLIGAAIPVARVLGIALIALGVASGLGTPLCGMLIYNLLATVYFTHLAIGGEWAGPLMWPAVGLHAVLTILLGRTWLMSRK
jgi:hypothetical protein